MFFIRTPEQYEAEFRAYAAKAQVKAQREVIEGRIFVGLLILILIALLILHMLHMT